MQKSDCHGVMDDGREHCMTLQVAHVVSESRLLKTVFKKPGYFCTTDKVYLNVFWKLNAMLAASNLDKLELYHG